MNRKSLIAILAVFMFLFSAAGCGTKANTPVEKTTNLSETAAKETGQPEKEVKFRMAWWGNDARHKATVDAIKLYTEQNKNISIDAEYSGFDGYQQKLFTQIAAGQAPELFQVARVWFSQLYEENNGKRSVVDFKKENLVKLDLFDQNLLNSVCEYKGIIMGIPVGLNADPSSMKNLDFFKKYNIPEDMELTWDNIVSYGKSVHATDKEAYMLPPMGDRLIPVYIQQKTGKLLLDLEYNVNFTEDDAAEAFKFFRMLQDEGIMQPLKEVAPNENKIMENTRWQAGQIGIIFEAASIHPSSKVAGVRYAGDGFPIIKDAKDTALSVTSTMFWCINNTSDYKKEVGDFLTWTLTDNNAVLALTDVRGPQPLEASRNLLLEAGKIDEAVDQSLKAAAQKPGLDFAGGKTTDGAFSKELVNAYQKVLLTDTAPEKVAEDYFKAITTAASEMKKQMTK